MRNRVSADRTEWRLPPRLQGGDSFLVQRPRFLPAGKLRLIAAGLVGCFLLIGPVKVTPAAGDLGGVDLAKVVGVDPSHRAQMLCVLSEQARDGLGAYDIALALGPLGGVYRYSALRCLEPKISNDLDGPGLLQIVGDGLQYRSDMLCKVAGHARSGISAAEVQAALGPLSGVYRLNAVKCLEPQLAVGLSGEQLVQIVGAGTQYRSDMLCKVAGHARSGISAAEVQVALGPLSGVYRLNAVRCLEQELTSSASSGVSATSTPQMQLPSTSTSPIPRQPSAEAPGVLGACGSSKDFPILGEYQRFLLGDYLCFSSGGLIEPVPGAICGIGVFIGYRPVYFGTACLNHDRCYGQPGSRKSQCDQAFLSLMEMTCDESLPWPQARQTCRGAAIAAYESVRSMACEAFVAGQQTAGVANPVCD